jgi:hypothetical protein
MRDAVEAQTAEFSQSNDKFALAANLSPKMFDQPRTAAIRSGQWEHKHTLLNPDGIKANFGLYHLAPPRTNSAIHSSRQEGEILLVYFNGRMGTLFKVFKMIRNFLLS